MTTIKAMVKQDKQCATATQIKNGENINKNNKIGNYKNGCKKCYLSLIAETRISVHQITSKFKTLISNKKQNISLSSDFSHCKNVKKNRKNLLLFSLDEGFHLLKFHWLIIVFMFCFVNVLADDTLLTVIIFLFLKKIYFLCLVKSRIN